MLYALLGAALVGISLGLLGSGGSILTVPILVYLLGHEEKAAIAEALAIVGLISLAGAARAALRGMVDWRRVLLFGGPGMVGAVLGGLLARWVPGAAQVAMLGAIMLIAAYMMARRKDRERPVERPTPALLIILQGLGVGMITGLVGVGGGFLIVPALALLGGVPMHTAIGTSLAIITLNCAAGFSKYLTFLEGQGLAIDWRVIGIFGAVGVGGALVGGSIGSRVNQATLRKWFGVFLVLMGAYILWRQLPQVV
ncbi:MAG: sulfite exporter TauE/SafE family protein [Phycisphaeraceae bacterium]|nr:MAG: sulfite exporter TauE/SafE family protein [Phycisphaeraceae bacterium]